MNRRKASLVQEGVLWDLYQRLLAQQLLLSRLPAGRRARPGTGISAALSQNLATGDSLGLEASDLVTRYLCGGLPAFKEAAAKRRPRRLDLAGWAFPSDTLQGVLPGQGVAQARLAVGTALASRLHGDGAVTILMKSTDRGRDDRGGLPPEWEEAAALATTLELPLLLITSTRHGLSAAKAQPSRQAPALPAIPVERGDVVALYRVFYESISRARAGGGPTWIDGRDWLPAGSRRGARSAAGVAPLARMEASLGARGLWQPEQHRRMQRTLEAELKRAGWLSSAQP